MKPTKAFSILALVAGLAAPALAEPAPANPPQGQIMAGPGDGAAGPLTARTVTTIQSPRDPASGQSGNAPTTEGFKSVGGLSSETEFIGKNPGTGDQFIGGAGGDGTGIRRQQPAPKNVGQFAESGKKAEANVVQPNPQVDARTYREGGANDTTHRTKKPRSNRDGARGKRQHKP